MLRDARNRLSRLARRLLLRDMGTISNVLIIHEINVILSNVI
jgi:hypothetical protein